MMTEDKRSELLIDYLDGNLNTEQVAMVEQQLAADATWRTEYEELKAGMTLLEADQLLVPDTFIKQEFETRLAEHDQQEMPQIGQRSWQPWQIAASVALLAACIFGGAYYVRDQQRNEEIARLRAEMDTTKQLILGALDDQTSASKRLQGVNVALDSRDMDSDIIKALIHTMNHDANTNVRLAAVEALSQFSDRQTVRKALIDALNTQADVAVQVALINLMVQMEEKSAIKELQQMIDDQETNETVKDEAHMAVFKLS